MVGSKQFEIEMTVKAFHVLSDKLVRSNLIGRYKKKGIFSKIISIQPLASAAVSFGKEKEVIDCHSSWLQVRLKWEIDHSEIIFHPIDMKIFMGIGSQS